MSYLSSLIKILFFSFFILQFSSCVQPGESFVSFDNIAGEESVVINESNLFEGSASRDIVRIELYLGEDLVDEFKDIQNGFSYEFKGEEIGEFSLKLLGFNEADEQLVETQYKITVKEEDPIDESEVTDDGKLSVNLVIDNFSESNREKALEAKSLLVQVINSEAFKQKVLNHMYDGKKGYANNNGLTNEQIYERILTGEEVLNGIVDHEVDLEIILYTPSWYDVSGRNVVGYTYPDTETIHSNTKFFYSFSTAQIAGNWFHEWLHNLGFQHDSRSTARRPYSVPYGIGKIVEELAVQL